MSTGTKTSDSIYTALASRLRQQIRSGEYKPGELIDSEHNLAKKEAISRMTVRRASGILVKEGLIERRPGKGLFVRDTQTATRKIQVIAGNLRWEPALQASRGVQTAAHDFGIQPFLYDAHGNAEQDLQTLRALPDSGYSGAVIVSLHSKAFNHAIFELDRVGFPFVLVDQKFRDLDVLSVSADNYGGGYAAGQHLLELGHKRLGFIGDIVANTVSERLQGFRDAIADAALPVDRRLIIDLGPNLDRLGDWSDHVQAVTRDLMALPDPPTAIFCSCDAIARSCHRGLAAMGISTPQDVSLVGFDNDPLAEWMTPPLTTVQQPFFEMGQVALGLLNDLMADDYRPSTMTSRTLPVQLVKRASVAQARSDSR